MSQLIDFCFVRSGKGRWGKYLIKLRACNIKKGAAKNLLYKLYTLLREIPSYAICSTTQLKFIDETQNNVFQVKKI